MLTFLIITTRPCFRADFNPGLDHKSRRLHSLDQNRQCEIGWWSDVAVLA